MRLAEALHVAVVQGVDELVPQRSADVAGDQPPVVVLVDPAHPLVAEERPGVLRRGNRDEHGVARRRFEEQVDEVVGEPLHHSPHLAMGNRVERGRIGEAAHLVLLVAVTLFTVGRPPPPQGAVGEPACDPLLGLEDGLVGRMIAERLEVRFALHPVEAAPPRLDGPQEIGRGAVPLAQPAVDARGPVEHGGVTGALFEEPLEQRRRRGVFAPLDAALDLLLERVWPVDGLPRRREVSGGQQKHHHHPQRPDSHRRRPSCQRTGGRRVRGTDSSSCRPARMGSVGR